MKPTRKLELIMLIVFAAFGIACMIISFPHVDNWKLIRGETDFWNSSFSIGSLITFLASCSIILELKEEKPSA